MQSTWIVGALAVSTVAAWLTKDKWSPKLSKYYEVIRDYNTQDTLIINPINKTATIKYFHLGRQYSLLVPYYEDKKLDMLKYEINVDYEGTKQYIDQPIGIPLLVSADDLKASHLEVTDRDDNVTACLFGRDLPTY